MAASKEGSRVSAIGLRWVSESKILNPLRILAWPSYFKPYSWVALSSVTLRRNPSGGASPEAGESVAVSAFNRIDECVRLCRGGWRMQSKANPSHEFADIDY